MKKLMIVALTALMACAGGEKEEIENGITITGKVDSPLSGIITLNLLEGNVYAVKDTIELDKDNTFTYVMESTEPLIYQLNFYDIQSVNLIVDQDDIDVHVSGNNPNGKSLVEGSPDMEYLNKVNKTAQKFQAEMQSLNQEFMVARQEQDSEKMESINEKMKVLNSNAIESIKNEIDEMGLSIAALFAVNYIISDENFEFLDALATKFKEGRPNSIYTRNFITRVEAMRRLSIGQLAPDFTLPNTEGEMVSLSSFRGNYVLVDFWAKWCKPCRLENPNIVKAYQKFHDKGFEVLGVSLDRSREDWLKAIEDDGLTWTHVSDLKYWSSEVVSLYEIKGIPFAVLLDPEGKIIAKNLRGDALESKLEEVLL